MKVLNAYEVQLEQAAEQLSLAEDDRGVQQLAALRETGVAFLLAMDGPDLGGRLQALMQRLDNGLDTQADRAMLAALPTCYLDPDELVRLFARADQGL
jgi:hypothetical protein